MQFKLLNFHKMLANISVNLINLFIPLILYTYTGKLIYSFLFLIMQYASRVVITTLFHKIIEKRPQLFLLIRVVPMLIYASSMILMDYNLWLAVGIMLVSGSFSDSFANFSNEVILNYSSLNKSGKSFGLTRMVEQVGVIFSVLIGGVILDNLSKIYVTVIAIVIYLISAVPLFIYYIKYRKQPNFNKEAISNAFLTYGQRPDRTKRGKLTTKKILTQYFIVYTLMCFMDSLLYSYNLYAFSQIGTFTYASFVSAAFSASLGISSYLVGRLSEKKDTTLISSIASCFMALLVIPLVLFNNQIVAILIFAVIGGLYPFASLFLIERMLMKTRILGYSNQALSNRESAINIGKLSALIPAVFGSVIPTFIVIIIAYFTFGLMLPRTEERTRKMLVAYLQREE